MVRDGTASIHRRRAGKGAGNEADDPAAAFTESHGVLRRGHFREVPAARRVDLQRLQRRPGNQHPTRRGDELRPVDQPLRVYLVAGERQGDPEGPFAGGTAAEPAQQITVVIHHLGVGGALPGTANAAHPDVRLLIVAQALDPQRRIEGKRRDTRRLRSMPAPLCVRFPPRSRRLRPHPPRVATGPDRPGRRQGGRAWPATPGLCGGSRCPAAGRGSCPHRSSLASIGQIRLDAAARASTKGRSPRPARQPRTVERSASPAAPSLKDYPVRLLRRYGQARRSVRWAEAMPCVVALGTAACAASSGQRSTASRT